MKATVTHRFYGAEDGKIYPRWIEVGEVVQGELAQCAIAQGDAIPEKKREALKPENVKISTASHQAQVSQEPTAKKRGGRKAK